ncbi:MAG: hypothetical protein ACI936_003694 [Paraglaciecola sp.]|jgi:hypothetical protein
MQTNEPPPKLTALANQIETLAKEYLLSADLKALQGMIKAQQASLGGLKLAKQANDMFQNALSTDPYVFYDVTYAELGWLYHCTPGWRFCLVATTWPSTCSTKP